MLFLTDWRALVGHAFTLAPNWWFGGLDRREPPEPPAQAIGGRLRCLYPPRRFPQRRGKCSLPGRKFRVRVLSKKSREEKTQIVRGLLERYRFCSHLKHVIAVVDASALSMRASHRFAPVRTGSHRFAPVCAGSRGLASSDGPDLAKVLRLP